MSPSANTRGARAKTPSPSAKGSPSSASSEPQPLSFRFSSNATVRSPPQAKSTDTGTESTDDASSKRKELLDLLMSPKAHEDSKTRELFAQKLSAYSRVEQLQATDILLQIATSFFGLKKYKICLIGGAGVGKSAFVKKLKTGSFQQSYQPTHGADVTSLIFSTNRGGPIHLELWDCAGTEKHGILRDGYYINSDAALMMYDLTTVASYRALGGQHKDFTRVCGNEVPVVIIANKADDKKKRKKMSAMFERKTRLKSFEASAKSGLGGMSVNVPLLHVLKKLTGDGGLSVSFVSEEHCELPSGDESAIAEGASQLSLEDRPPTPQSLDVKAAAAVPLPESEDEYGGP